MNGRYDVTTYQKHKRPKGWGSLCPHPPEAVPDPQALLDSGVLVDRCVYNVDGERAYCAEEHQSGMWHGYPIPWTRIPSEAVERLIATGRLTDARYRKAIRAGWGREGER